MDCAMLLVRVYGDLGLIPKLEPRPYSPQWHLHRSEEIYLGWVEMYSKPVAVPLPGDLVLYKFGRCVSHGAIVVSWPKIIHANLNIGCVVDDGTQGRLRNRVFGFYSLFGEE